MVQESTEGYLNGQVDRTGTGLAHEIWMKLRDEYNNRLWYQFSVTLLNGLRQQPVFVESIGDPLQMYKHCVEPIQDKINPMCVAELAAILYLRVKDRPVAESFLRDCLFVVKSNAAAAVLVKTSMLSFALTNKDKEGRCIDIDAIRFQRDQLAKEVDALSGVTAAHAPFYHASSIYYREIADFGSFYTETLKYLGCADIETLSAKEQNFLAKCMAIAAMLGKQIYNFGELLAHPILNSLNTDADRWMLQMLRAFNSGDWAVYAQVKARAFQTYSDLANNESLLVEKIQLLAVMELAFERGGGGRPLPFDEIAARCQIGVNDVEMVVMRAMARGLIRGHIDGVARTVHVSWLQPRVLDLNQIRKLANRMDAWARDVQDAANLVETNAKEILVNE